MPLILGALANAARRDLPGSIDSRVRSPRITAMATGRAAGISLSELGKPLGLSRPNAQRSYQEATRHADGT